jgi:hypothetical protein
MLVILPEYRGTAWGKLTWSLKSVENNPVEIKFTPDQGEKHTLRTGEIPGSGNQITARIGDDYMAARIPLPPEDYVILPSWKQKEPVLTDILITGRVTVSLNITVIGMTTSRIETRLRIDGIGFTRVPGEGPGIGPGDADINTCLSLCKGDCRKTLRRQCLKFRRDLIGINIHYPDVKVA